MKELLYPLLLCIVYISYLEWTFHIEKGMIKRIICYSMVLVAILCSSFFHLAYLGLLLMVLISFLFVLFYGDELFIDKMQYFLGNTAILIISFLLCFLLQKGIDYLLVTLIFTGFNFMLLLYVRKQRNPLIYIMEMLLIMISIYIYLLNTQGIILLFVFLQIAILEYMYQLNRSHFENSTKAFQSDVVLHHYEEVKIVYLNMRGWRHDYHNHLQTIKAYLQMDQLNQVNVYLQELEEDLDKVDTLVKSGNLMVDAILNSKLSLAMSKNISLNHTATVLEHISITDLDLCVILGNLLDNAIEACMRVDEKDRFIRVYISILKQQLYISITNSAIEELSGNGKNYISEKRGDHGHGMKRVQLTVDKYNGYLNVQNEPGVFVCEVMLPLVYES